MDCIARKLQDCWRTATLSVVLKILKDSLLSSSYVRATHLSRASGTDSARDIHVPRIFRVKNLKSFSPKRGSISITTGQNKIKIKCKRSYIFCLLLKENEDVVQAALEANGDKFTLGHPLPSWTHRGLAVFPGGEF